MGPGQAKRKAAGQAKRKASGQAWRSNADGVELWLPMPVAQSKAEKSSLIASEFRRTLPLERLFKLCEPNVQKESRGL